MKVTSPEVLQTIIDRGPDYRRAIALIEGKWEELLLAAPWGMTTISLNDVKLMQAYLAAEVVAQPKYTLASYADVQRFVQEHHTRITPAVRDYLLAPYQM